MMPLISQLCFSLCFFLSTAVYATCETATLPAPFSSLTCRAVTHENTCKQLCVLRTDQESHWFLFSAQSFTVKLDIPASFYGVTAFEISPTEHWIAIASAGEGHPALDVFPLQPLLENQAVEARYSINPYPGSIDMERWEDAEHLRITTDRWLPYNTPLFEEKYVQFRLNVTTGEYSTDDKDLTNPVKYYEKMLTRLTDDWEKQEAMNALKQIQP
ncbi:hypothetical protein [Beggiatoa leptomitoformis]|uniref:Uncharacterized protein n=1 Tax=Beggiatoa leptomitoformis TaxID=288004 RepID=A0A2N9YGJ9_9GAMM|nr:hypothetical protein [Beggiatoa leptomitoformis]ALG68057.2 hypothetical protein AL038_10500 [Beggiatoa leptomitoformis]AUI69652.2 hypothetical protein BLE401_13775 [Beggiatoa leptomitoformis]